MDDVGDEVELCGMCQSKQVRYIHIMEHREYPDQLRVGFQCAENMEEDYVNPKARDTRIKGRAKRKELFMNKQWVAKPDAKYILKHRGINLMIMMSRHGKAEFGVYVGRNQNTWIDGNNKRILTFDRAREIAFNLVDPIV